MPLFGDIRRALRSQRRVRGLAKEISRLNDSLSVIARGINTFTIREYGIDLLAPPAMTDPTLDPGMPVYTNDREQALQEAERDMIDALNNETVAYGREADENALARLLDD